MAKAPAEGVGAAGWPGNVSEKIWKHTLGNPWFRMDRPDGPCPRHAASRVIRHLAATPGPAESRDQVN